MRRSSSAVRPDLFSTVVELIVVPLAWYEAWLQLAFEEVAQQPEESLTTGLRQIRPQVDYLPGIGRGELCWVRDWTWNTTFLML
ncbi:hypothetical protein KSC_104520 [Ktedonobacter sp. SOSP1-52]|nr:hypothetical protein KSC_104520 [Ktedonobacter sp. SOSP1-52]